MVLEPQFRRVAVGIFNVFLSQFFLHLHKSGHSALRLNAVVWIKGYTLVVQVNGSLLSLSSRSTFSLSLQFKNLTMMGLVWSEAFPRGCTLSIPTLTHPQRDKALYVANHITSLTLLQDFNELSCSGFGGCLLFLSEKIFPFRREYISILLTQDCISVMLSSLAPPPRLHFLHLVG